MLIINNKALKTRNSHCLNFLDGHSTLIKKIGSENSIFFDPNTGEHQNLSFENLCDKIDKQLKQWNGIDLVFIRLLSKLLIAAPNCEFMR